MLRGDFELAHAKIEQGLRLHSRPQASDAPRDVGEQSLLEGLAHSVLGRIASQSGQLAAAHVRFTAVLACNRRTKLRAANVEPLADDVACLVGLGELEQASRELVELSDLADVLARPWWDALVARTRALVAAAKGDTGSALAELEQAVELLESLPQQWPYELGRTLLLQGAAQRRARQKLTARATLERALELFEGLGARLWAEKARAELRQISGRPSRPGRLTETEGRIAERVAAGRSNAEVASELSLSPKTVEWNLSKIYRKLGVRSRTQLAAKLARETVA